MDFKELFIEEQERIAAELEETGFSANDAWDKAADQAYDAARDRLADMGDFLRKQAKERQCPE